MTDKLVQSDHASAFELAQRKAVALSKSELVPKEYRNNPANCLIAIELADRIGASPLMVLQNLHLIHGRPSWSSTFMISAVNSTGRWTPLKFRMEGKPGAMDWGCRAVARDRETDEECVGPIVTMQMAKDEGWSTKSGSKWKTLPELMLMYRAATFWSRLYAPEVTMGIRTADELEDLHASGAPSAVANGDIKALQEALLEEPIPAEAAPEELDLFEGQP